MDEEPWAVTSRRLFVLLIVALLAIAPQAGAALSPAPDPAPDPAPPTRAGSVARSTAHTDESPAEPASRDPFASVSTNGEISGPASGSSTVRSPAIARVAGVELSSSPIAAPEPGGGVSAATIGLILSLIVVTLSSLPPAVQARGGAIGLFLIRRRGIVLAIAIAIALGALVSLAIGGNA